MEKVTQTLPRVKYPRCVCGHILLIHGGYGCEGLYTGHDTGQFGPEPCGCHVFKAMQESMEVT